MEPLHFYYTNRKPLLEPKSTCTGAGFPCTLHYVGISMILPIPPCSAERTNSASLILASNGWEQWEREHHQRELSRHIPLWHVFFFACTHVCIRACALLCCTLTFCKNTSYNGNFQDLRNAPSPQATFEPRACISGTTKKSIKQIPSCAINLQSCGYPGHSSWVNHFNQSLFVIPYQRQC